MAHGLEPELEATAHPTILLVEDDDDNREVLVRLLQRAGFTPQACRTAEEGLEQLREQRFDIVLTDYTLPHRSGGWLLHQASGEGLLDTTPALLVTDHPDPVGVVGHEVIFKPIDLDHLVERVRQRLESGNAKVSKPRRAPRTSSGKSPNDGRGDCPEPIELILYVSAHSSRSATAIENIRKVLSRHKSNRVKLTVCDLSQPPTLGNADSVVVTPTLVKRSPGPRTFILGHITNPELLLELLEGCEES
jgi:DNA-binding response OmpR family regulator